ncbi:MAG: division/cell wall cluster transcriptional repressor MraZ [Planctomycetes bacterium]|nr:division/cell wall cluster transcriptional repressor MraZ [Planctomycetota bacterium]
MPLSGTYTRALDDKQRVAVPKRLCEDFNEPELKHLFVAPGTEKSLMLYSPAGFEKLARRTARLSPNSAQVRNYKRLFYSRAERVDLDAQGRIRIPDRLVAFAGLSRDVVIAGVHDHAEIWDAVAWEKFLQEHTSAFDEMATQAFE